ncbi:hypothetical protein HNP81_001305 [Peribacillus huizhouensis]|uniref:Uncharacterized protein n=1 Tax=Peribacillus huizhouensis TaxID=1501239 RepID=A0ABR6CLV9_9BACI|nr:hypothetical protein [Peribacillus huizhouensis]
MKRAIQLNKIKPNFYYKKKTRLLNFAEGSPIHTILHISNHDSSAASTSSVVAIRPISGKINLHGNS